MRFVHESRLAVRSLLRARTFTAISVATLALGIGAAVAARLVAAGVLVALPVAALAGRVVESQLYGVRALDPTTSLGAALALASAALLASSIPARRAAAVDPAQSLRSE